MSDSARRERCPPDSSVNDSFHTSPNATRTSNPDQATSQLSMAHAHAEASCKALYNLSASEQLYSHPDPGRMQVGRSSISRCTHLTHR